MASEAAHCSEGCLLSYRADSIKPWRSQNTTGNRFSQQVLQVATRKKQEKFAFSRNFLAPRHFALDTFSLTLLDDCPPTLLQKKNRLFVSLSIENQL